ncbi:hypothetical protein [Bradyrhizobium cenepequi]
MTDGLKTLIATLEENAPGRSAEARRQKAVTAWATMVGALMLSRVVDDEELSEEILKRAKRDLARRIPQKAAHVKSVVLVRGGCRQPLQQHILACVGLICRTPNNPAVLAKRCQRCPSNIYPAGPPGAV